MKDDKEKNRLVVDDYAAEIVRDIFRWKIDGMSQQGIADRLNALGVLSPYEYKHSIGLKFHTSFKQSPQAMWSAVAVGRILKDEIYMGVLAQGKTSTPNHKVKKNYKKSKDDWIRVSGRHEPIISRNEFELVNSLLLKDMRVAPNENTVHLLSGMLRCSDCNESMVRKTIPFGDKKYYYYVCGKSKKGLCKSHNVSESKLIEAVTASLQAHMDFILDIDRILEYIDTLPLKRDEVQKLDGQILRKKEYIERIKNRRVTLYENMTEGIIDEEEYLDLRKRYSAQLAEAEGALLALGAEIDGILNSKAEKNLWIENFRACHNFAELTRKILVSFIGEILVYEGNRIEIIPKYKTNLDTAINPIDAEEGLNPLKNIETVKELM